jgi:hypothetical protein
MKASWTRITINGVNYAGVEEMPPDVRQQYEQTLGKLMADRDGDGVPDVLQGKAPAGDKSTVVIKQVKSIVVNGQRYESLSDAPAEVQRMLAAEFPQRTEPMYRSSADPDELQWSWRTMLLLAALIALAVALVAWWMQHRAHNQ